MGVGPPYITTFVTSMSIDPPAQNDRVIKKKECAKVITHLFISKTL